MVPVGVVAREHRACPVKPEGRKKGRKEGRKEEGGNRLLTFPDLCVPPAATATSTAPHVTPHHRRVGWLLLLALVAGLPAGKVYVGAGGADPVPGTGLVLLPTPAPAAAASLRLPRHHRRVGRPRLAAVVALGPPAEVVVVALHAEPVAWREGGRVGGRVRAGVRVGLWQSTQSSRLVEGKERKKAGVGGGGWARTG